MKYTKLPKTAPSFTNWMDIEHNGITRLCGKYDYMKRPSNITHINLYSGQIDFICEETLNEIFYNSEVRFLNLAKNKFKVISRKFNETGWEKSNYLQKLWLGGNPVQCDCNMLWLISWLNNTRVSGQRLVQDYQDVICTGGEWDGIPVYKLNQVKMGCYPDKVATWIIVVSSAIGGLILITVIIVITVYQHWILVRWWMYKHFDKLIGNPDKMEDLTGMEYDAFLSYRLTITIVPILCASGINQSIDQSINQSINQSIDQSVNQSINQSVMVYVYVNYYLLSVELIIIYLKLSSTMLLQILTISGRS